MAITVFSKYVINGEDAHAFCKMNKKEKKEYLRMIIPKSEKISLKEISDLVEGGIKPHKNCGCCGQK